MSNQHLKVEAVAERLAVSPKTVRKWLREGRLSGVKLTPGAAKSEWRVTENALADFANGLTP